MYRGYTIATITPVLNEAASIGAVIDSIPDWVDDIVVVDNGSEDGTAEVAAIHGARVVHAARRGYGSACLVGIASLQTPDFVVFLDGDFSDHPEEMPLLLDPLVEGGVDLVIGSRVRGALEPGAMTPQAVFGNWLATRLIHVLWGVRYTDLGPFRAIRHGTLLNLGMRDPDYGWTVEMQIKAALRGVPACEVPVSYRKRIGVSKVSGTVRGVIGAAYKILGTILVSALLSRRRRYCHALCIFTRFPVPGDTKTRLIPALGPEGAADLQRQMTEHTVATARPRSTDVWVEVRFHGGTSGQIRTWLGDDLVYVPQGEGDLGRKMSRAFREHFDRGMAGVVLIGTDCPALTARHTAAAFDGLGSVDVVMGPAEDGGYYLLGVHARVGDGVEALLEGVAWGTGGVLETTRANAARLGLTVSLLETLADVDRPEDLDAWARAKRSSRA